MSYPNLSVRGDMVLPRPIWIYRDVRTWQCHVPTRNPPLRGDMAVPCPYPDLSG